MTKSKAESGQDTRCGVHDAGTYSAPIRSFYKAIDMVAIKETGSLISARGRCRLNQ